MSDSKKVLGVRVPEQIKDWLAGKARDNDRSVSGELVCRLRKMMEQEAADEKNKQA